MPIKLLDIKKICSFHYGKNEYNIIRKQGGRTIQLSQEGKIFLDYVSKSLQILDEGIHAIQPKKDIKISSIPTVINSFLVPFIIHLQKEQPQINIQFRSEKTETITQKILENQRQSFTIYSSY